MSEKIEKFWEDATADDVAKIANTRKSIQARFRDEDNEGWVDCSLVGWKLSKHLPGAIWIDADGAAWKQCQVYREPSWYANKPDPGEGYRLLEKFPGEEPQLGDSVFCPGSEIWLELEAGFDPGQRHGLWYRRRIEPVEPVESKPVLIRRRVVEIGDEFKLPNGRVWVFNGEGLEVKQ